MEKMFSKFAEGAQRDGRSIRFESILEIPFSGATSNHVPSLEELLEWKSNLTPPKDFEWPSFLWSFRSSLLRYSEVSPMRSLSSQKWETFERNLETESIPLKIWWRFMVISLSLKSPEVCECSGSEKTVYLTTKI
eukprot:Gregarina_sp_Poly_1__8443@NODE_497_length_7922_cov_26_990834_g53_i1_p6_GENE_NODE_497_length_7922_cov_26_990834_g53_i1NODE_497_length_7922_cov_26_990834_g53_i1_p6_ORF_typecomplete_len135_score21_21_NODE_497_length_7922_cov_26_990834_g53_i110931497